MAVNASEPSQALSKKAYANKRTATMLQSSGNTVPPSACPGCHYQLYHEDFCAPFDVPNYDQGGADEGGQRSSWYHILWFGSDPAAEGFDTQDGCAAKCNESPACKGYEWHTVDNWCKGFTNMIASYDANVDTGCGNIDTYLKYRGHEHLDTSSHGQMFQAMSTVVSWFILITSYGTAEGSSEAPKCQLSAAASADPAQSGLETAMALTSIAGTALSLIPGPGMAAGMLEKGISGLGTLGSVMEVGDWALQDVFGLSPPDPMEELAKQSAEIEQCFSELVGWVHDEFVRQKLGAASLCMGRAKFLMKEADDSLRAHGRVYTGMSTQTLMEAYTEVAEGFILMSQEDTMSRTNAYAASDLLTYLLYLAEMLSAYAGRIVNSNVAEHRDQCTDDNFNVLDYSTGGCDTLSSDVLAGFPSPCAFLDHVFSTITNYASALRGALNKIINAVTENLDAQYNHGGGDAPGAEHACPVMRGLSPNVELRGEGNSLIYCMSGHRAVVRFALNHKVYEARMPDGIFDVAASTRKKYVVVALQHLLAPKLQQTEAIAHRAICSGSDSGTRQMTYEFGGKGCTEGVVRTTDPDPRCAGVPVQPPLLVPEAESSDPFACDASIHECVPGYFGTAYRVLNLHYMYGTGGYQMHSVDSMEACAAKLGLCSGSGFVHYVVWASWASRCFTFTAIDWHSTRLVRNSFSGGKATAQFYLEKTSCKDGTVAVPVEPELGGSGTVYDTANAITISPDNRVQRLWNLNVEWKPDFILHFSVLYNYDQTYCEEFVSEEICHWTCTAVSGVTFSIPSCSQTCGQENVCHAAQADACQTSCPTDATTPPVWSRAFIVNDQSHEGGSGTAEGERVVAFYIKNAELNPYVVVGNPQNPNAGKVFNDVSMTPHEWTDFTLICQVDWCQVHMNGEYIGQFYSPNRPAVNAVLYASSGTGASMTGKLKNFAYEARTGITLVEDVTLTAEESSLAVAAASKAARDVPDSTGWAHMYVESSEYNSAYCTPLGSASFSDAINKCILDDTCAYLFDFGCLSLNKAHVDTWISEGAISQFPDHYYWNYRMCTQDWSAGNNGAESSSVSAPTTTQTGCALRSPGVRVMHTFTFDSPSSTGWSTPGASGSFGFTRKSSSTPSQNTGPTGGPSTSAPYYYYAETSSPRASGDEFEYA